MFISEYLILLCKVFGLVQILRSIHAFSSLFYLTHTTRFLFFSLNILPPLLGRIPVPQNDRIPPIHIFNHPKHT